MSVDLQTKVNPAEETVFSAQVSEVHRLLGRCLLRLQHYENLAKKLLVLSDFDITFGDIQGGINGRIDRFAKFTLGQIINKMTDGVFVDASATTDSNPEDDAPTDKLKMSFRFSMETDSEQLEIITTEMKELVEMRNELVHHFLVLFDLRDDLGCDAAVVYLEDCLERIKPHQDNMRSIVENLTQAIDLWVQLASSPDYIDMIADGIMPDGKVDWRTSRIVGALKQAALQFSEQEWTNLDIASAWIEQNFPGQNPSRYKRRSWPQVLQDSGLFDIQIRISHEHKRKVRWYRERSAA